MQHVFSVGGNSITFRASPFVSYNHPQMEQPADPTPKEPTPPPPPPPPQQKLLIKLRVSDLGSGSSSSTGPKTLKQNGTSDEEEADEQQPLQIHDEAPVKRRGGGPGSRGKRRKVDQGPGTPTSDDGLSVAWDSSASATPTKRGRGGKGSRGGAGRGRGGRKSGLQHQVLPVPIPGTPDSAGELSLRPASPSSESTSNVALTPTPISTPTIPIPTSVLPPPQPSTPSEIDPALLATAPRRPLPTRAFPVQPAPKTSATAPIVGNGGIDWNKRCVRRWGVKMREVRGVGGGSWWVRTWVGSSESEYASDPARILAVPTTLPRSSSTTSLNTKQRKTESSWATKARKSEARSGTLPTEPAIKVEPSSSSVAGTSHYRDQEGVELLTAFATSGGGGGGGGGIGANHYREREFNQAQSSGASTPNVSVPKVKYDFARDGIEEVVPSEPESTPAPAPVPGPPSTLIVRGAGKPKPVMPNGSAKGKEKAVEDGPLVVESGTGADAGAGGDARARSGSGYEQAARDVEMELMGET